MKHPEFRLRAVAFVVCGLLSVALFSQREARAQAQTPLTNDEFVRMVRQLPTSPTLKDDLINEIRRRGIGFPLTSGLLSLVATKSGNDVLLRRTLEEAERRRLDPAAVAVPSVAEGRDVLEKTREATLAAAEAMPDFVVKQQIVRAYARALTRNWNVSDRLTIAVSYSAKEGEQYRVLAVNGFPQPQSETRSGNSLEKLGGATSTGEYVSRLALIFRPESNTDFKLVDTDTLRGRRTVIYEYDVKKDNARGILNYNNGAAVTTTGDRGRLWIDREKFRVLRLESVSTDIPSDFPITKASRSVDYDWVVIGEREYLLPSRAVVEMTAIESVRRMAGVSVLQSEQYFQSRNDVRFRNYQKYGTEVKILDDDQIIDESEPEKKP